MDDYSGQIDWDEHPSPAEWFAVPGNPGGHTGVEAWTLSPAPNVPGWSTDCGCSGYGLPREIAEGLAKRLNATPPRSWHYVTEKLPERGAHVRFWRRSIKSSKSYGDEGIFTYRGAVPFFGLYSTAEHFSRTVHNGIYVYAWEPKPEPPPLPESAAEPEIPRFRVLPVGGLIGGWQVVERTPEGYDIPRGWTYESEDVANRALPLVAAGSAYPSPEALAFPERDAADAGR